MNAGQLNHQNFRMPAEWEKHEGTWLQWPNNKGFFRNQFKHESTWLKMVDALCLHEIVHITVMDERQKEHVEYMLRYFKIGPENVDIHVITTNDVWARDNGPIFVVNDKGDLAITNWTFNGWGNRFESDLDNQVPGIIGKKLDVPVFTPPLVLEGGAVEVNGKGTFMATASSVINPNRNPGKSQQEIEKIISDYFGITHFIWLPGKGKEAESWGDTTDSHVDIVARFVDETTVLYNVTDDKSDPRYEMLKDCYDVLKESVTESGKPLNLVPLPMPKNGVHRVSPVDAYLDGSYGDYIEDNKENIVFTSFTDGSYSNYLVANNVVLVPVFGNICDGRAKSIIADLHPGRKVIGIPCVELMEDGGAIHCVTQQQPSV